MALSVPIVNSFRRVLEVILDAEDLPLVDEAVDPASVYKVINGL